MTFRSELDQAVQSARDALQAHPLDPAPLKAAAWGFREIRAKTIRSPEQDQALDMVESRLEHYRRTQHLSAGVPYERDPEAAEALADAVDAFENAFATYTLTDEWRHLHAER